MDTAEYCWTRLDPVCPRWLLLTFCQYSFLLALAGFCQVGPCIKIKLTFIVYYHKYLCWSLTYTETFLKMHHICGTHYLQFVWHEMSRTEFLASIVWNIFYFVIKYFTLFLEIKMSLVFLIVGPTSKINLWYSGGEWQTLVVVGNFHLLQSKIKCTKSEFYRW